MSSEKLVPDSKFKFRSVLQFRKAFHLGFDLTCSVQWSPVCWLSKHVSWKVWKGETEQESDKDDTEGWKNRSNKWSVKYWNTKEDEWIQTGWFPHSEVNTDRWSSWRIIERQWQPSAVLLRLEGLCKDGISLQKGLSLIGKVKRQVAIPGEKGGKEKERLFILLV